MSDSSNAFYPKNGHYKIFGGSDDESQKLIGSVDQLKQLVTILLHCKYMLNFLHKNLSVDVLKLTLKNAAPDFQADLQVCFSKFNQFAENCIFVDLIREKEEHYESKFESYCSFKGGQFISNEKSLNLDNQSTALEADPIDSNLIDTLITEEHDDLIGLTQHHLNEACTFSSNDEIDRQNNSYTRGGENSDTSRLMTNNQSQSTEFNFEDMQTNEECNTAVENAANNSDSESSKLYASLLGLLPTTSASEPQASSSKEFANAQQASTSGLKRSSTRTGPSRKYQAKETDEEESAVQRKEITVAAELSGTEDSNGESAMHVENDLLQVEYWCSYEGCRFKSKSLTQVKAHEERRHVRHIVKCSEDGCGSFFDTKDDLNLHLTDIHAGPMYKCALHICSKEFQSDYRLKQHIREEHKEEYLTCKVCTKKFKTRKYLTRHCRNVHPKDKLIDEMVAAASEGLDPKGSQMSCTIDNCDKKFLKRSKLKQHIKETHKEEYLTCNFCDKVCKTRNNLTNHIWIMHEEGDFSCPFDECDFSSKFRKNLLNHKKLRHQRVRKCPMNDCGEMIPITRYQRHMSSLHKIKNYACSWPDCGKSFADHNALKNHVRIHLNFKRYKCKWEGCGYASEQRFTVITHIRVVHFKIPRTKKKQIEMNITLDSVQNPYDYLEVCREDICI